MSERSARRERTGWRRPMLLLLSGSRRIIDKAHALGVEVVHVEAPTMSEPALADLCLRSVCFDLRDVAGAVALARDLHRQFAFDGVLSNHEPASAAAEAIALDLDLTAPGKGVAALLRDKIRTREVLDAHAGLRSPWAEVRSAGDIRALARHVGYPVVLKPGDGSASLGVVAVRDAGQVDAAWQRVRATLDNRHRYHEVLPVTRYLAEPFVRGTEYSVETFSRQGRHEVYAVVRKLTDGSFVEVGHVVPAELDPGAQDAIVARVFAFLDQVGLREGPAHTEVIVSGTDVYLVESHARTGGDEIPDLVRLAGGRDPEADMIAHFCGLPPPRPVAPAAPAAAKAYLIADRAGRVVDVHGRGDALALAGVTSVDLWVAEGDEVGPAAASWDRLGAVVAVGPDPRAAWSAAEQARDLLTVRVRPHPDGASPAEARQGGEP